MRSVDASVLAALQARAVVERQFIYMVAKNRSTGDPEPVGFWNDVGSITAPVVDALTGLTVSRSFFGSGPLIDIKDIPLTSDVGIREVTAILSQVDANVAQAVRGYEPKGAPTQIYRGLFSPAPRALIVAAVPRFVGFVNHIEIVTPKEGEFGSITVTLVSHVRELTRANTETRSDESQKARTGGSDRIFKYAGVAADWEMWWGQTKGKAPGSDDKKTPPKDGGGKKKKGGGKKKKK